MKLLLSVLLLCHAMPLAAATDPVSRAQEAAALLEEAAVALEEADNANDRVSALTSAVRAYETGLEALRESLRQATIREAAITRSFEAEQTRLSELLGVLQTLGRTPAPVLLIHPDGPIGAARSGMMVSEVTPAVAREAEELRDRLEELAALRAVQSEAEAQLAEGLRGVQDARVALSETIGRRVRIPDGARPDPVMLGVLAASSESLEAFAAGLDEIDAPAAPPGFEADRGTLPLPLSAAVLRGFGEADRAGIERPGLVLAVAGQALATSPSAASVRYVGTLLDYGNVIVLEPEADFLLILAGLEAIYVQPGEVLAPGEPLGLMGGSGPSIGSIAGGQTRQETLYLELRQDGRPVDPAEWFVTDRN